MKLASAPKEIATDDAKLLAAARNAQNEGESFTTMSQSVQVARGVLELLFHLANGPGDAPDNVSWPAIADLIGDCRGRLDSVAAALYALELYDREKQAVADV
jgi:hypothetical protein